MTPVFKLFAATVPLALTVGCASLTTSNENQVRVETVDETGAAVADANCAILRGSVRSEFKTPAVIALAKGSQQVMIDCTKAGMPEGKAVLISRVGAATFGNILAGGLIGIAVDQATGKAYNYPDWIKIAMGKLLSFDRSNHVDGQPLVGKPIDGQPTSTVVAKPAAEMKKAEDALKAAEPAVTTTVATPAVDANAKPMEPKK